MLVLFHSRLLFLRSDLVYDVYSMSMRVVYSTIESLHI